ncbi:MAG: hypothetical protein K8R88_00820 [Armatimonadetes bacterium]|nr:hypothetical protein [Armatimonadota bacterium]
MAADQAKPTARPADIVIGLVHLVLGVGLFLLQWAVLHLIGILVIAVALSTIFRWKPGIILGQGLGIALLLLALLSMIASFGLKTGSGQPYPGSVVFVLGLILAGWATLFMVPFWRKI